MKLIEQQGESQFEPFILSLEIETQEEAEILMSLLGASYYDIAAMANKYHRFSDKPAFTGSEAVIQQFHSCGIFEFMQSKIR